MRDRPTLTHIALHVRDVEACIAFYRDVCGLVVARERAHPKGGRIVWLAEPGRERAFVLVLLPGGAGRNQSPRDFSHLGFALPSKAAVDAIAERGRAAGVLVWPPRQDAYPAGYYCGLSDPDGTMVEFSHGQPLGPGAPEGEGREGQADAAAGAAGRGDGQRGGSPVRAALDRGGDSA